MFDQMKMAKELMGNMNPSQIKDLLTQAKDSKKMMEDMVRKIVAEEIKKHNLVSKDEVEKMFRT